jgi:hypothetical protein
MLSVTPACKRAKEAETYRQLFSVSARYTAHAGDSRNRHFLFPSCHCSSPESDVCYAARMYAKRVRPCMGKGAFQSVDSPNVKLRTVNYPNHRRGSGGGHHFPITIMNVCIYCGSYVKQLGKFKTNLICLIISIFAGCHLQTTSYINYNNWWQYSQACLIMGRVW